MKLEPHIILLILWGGECYYEVDSLQTKQGLHAQDFCLETTTSAATFELIECLIF